jgi:hypothetical protein
MPRLIELIRQSAVPAGVIRSAAKGTLSLPPGEMVEVLVYLAEHSTNVKQDAQNTLAAWSDEPLSAVLADPNISPDVLDYFFAPSNCRPNVLKALMETGCVPDEKFVSIATAGVRDAITVLMSSERLRRAIPVLRALLQNPSLTSDEVSQIKEDLARLGAPPAEKRVQRVGDVEVDQWITEHASEIKAEEGKAFSLIGGIEGNVDSDNAEATEITEEAIANAPKSEEEPERLSTLQKLARLTVGERVQAAMKGNREERSILIRDGAKIVSSAVLASPKLSEAEIEAFASMKNVQESVLREIARNRKFIKSYVVLKSLTTNPRTPLDLSLTLVKNMLVPDLKGLSQNKNVPDTLRKTALKLFKMRSSPSGKAE